MKRKISALVAGLLLIGNVAMAKLATDEGALGGIAPGTDLDYVVEIYGTPNEDPEPKFAIAYDMYTKMVKYGDSVSFYCTSNSASGPFDVVMIHISANNGFATPRGIHVGSTRQEVYRAYGMPYINQGNGQHLWYSVEKRGNMVFHFKGNRVESISLGWNS